MSIPHAGWATWMVGHQRIAFEAGRVWGERGKQCGGGVIGRKRLTVCRVLRGGGSLGQMQSHLLLMFVRLHFQLLASLAETSRAVPVLRAGNPEPAIHVADQRCGQKEKIPSGQCQRGPRPDSTKEEFIFSGRSQTSQNSKSRLFVSNSDYPQRRLAHKASSVSGSTPNEERTILGVEGASTEMTPQPVDGRPRVAW